MLVLKLGVNRGEEAVLTTPAGQRIVVRMLEVAVKDGEASSVQVGIEADRDVVRISRQPFSGKMVRP